MRIHERKAFEAEVGAVHDEYKHSSPALPSMDAERFISYESSQQRKMRIAAGQALLVARARKDVNAFLEYLFTDPKRPEDRFEQQWFHREWAHAMMHNDRTIIIAPRDHGKTTQIIGHTLFALGHNPNLRIKIACASDARAKERLYEIVQHIQYNPRVREVFPYLEPADTGEWSKHKIILKRTMPHRDASVEAIGITSSVTGGRADLLIADDVVDRRNALTYPKLRMQVNQSWKSDWVNLLEPGSRVWYICTLWHKEDLSHDLMNSSAFHKRMYAIDSRFGSMWPTKWPESALRLRHAEIGSVEFNRAFRNQPTDLETQIVREDWIRYSKLDKTSLFTKYREHLHFIVSYDTATAVNSNSDYSACVIIAVDTEGQKAYIVDAWHKRCTIKEQSRLVYEDSRKYNPFRILIEKSGQATLDEWVINDHPELADKIEVTRPKVSKQQRLLSCTPLLESGRIVFNEHLNPDLASWDPAKEQLVNELLDFPFGKHDDLVDAFSQAVHAARRYFLDEWATGGENVLDVRIDGTDHDNEDENDGTPKYLF